MKKKQILAIMIASSMALSIVGCSGSETSASEGSSEIEVTEEEKKEIAKSEMVAADAASSAASSEPEAAAADNSAVPANAQETPATLSEDQILYNGKVISVLNDASKIFADLGTQERVRKISPNEDYYYYDSEQIVFSTFVDEGNNIPVSIAIYKPGMVTSRNVGIGETNEKIKSIYGNPTEIGHFIGGSGSEYSYQYKFDKFCLYFCFNEKSNKVTWIAYDSKDGVTKLNQAAKAAEASAKASKSATPTSTPATTPTPAPAPAPAPTPAPAPAPAPASNNDASVPAKEQPAGKEEKLGSCGKAYADIAKKSHDANSNIRYSLLYITTSKNPELVVDNPGHDISMYTFDNGSLVNITENLNYGNSPEGYGTTSYCYAPYSNLMLENTNNCLAYLMHFEKGYGLICDCVYYFMPFWPKVGEVVPSGNADAPSRDLSIGENYRRKHSGEYYLELSQSGLTEEAANRKMATANWAKIEGSMDYDTLISELQKLGL